MRLNKTIKKIILSTLIAFVVIGVFGIFNLALAQDRFGLENAAGVGLAQGDLRITIINIIRFILGFLGLVAVIIIMWGGYLWMTAGGDANKIAKAKRTLISAVIGLIIILSAFLIATFVISIIPTCQGADCPTDSCPTPPCTPTCDNPPCTPSTSNQYTYINKFKDDSIPWSRIIGSAFSGVARIPNSENLKVGGYAKNRDGTVVSMELFTAPLAGSFTAQSPFSDVPTDQEIVNNVFASWNSLSYAINDQYKAKISALLSGDKTIESREVKTIIKPLHCFNNVQDQGETGVDCGGDPAVLGDDYCGACDGGSCTEDSDCASGVCLHDGTCAFAPVIYSLEPNNGAVDNYITIWGRHFGAGPGSVMLIKDDVIVAYGEINAATDCINGWTDTQIVFKVPTVDLDNYQVVVENDIGLTSNSKEFTVNTIERPGICSIDPVYGVNPNPIEIAGNNFPTSPDGQVQWNFQPDIFSSPEVDWLSSILASDIVPESGVGTTSIRIYNGTEYSNYYNFIISRGEIGDPCGEPGASVCSAANVCNTGLFCDPNQSCTCQVVVNACEPGFSRSCDDFSPCTATEVCPVSGSWDDAVCTKTDPTCSPGVTVDPAVQSIFAWAFIYGNGYGFTPPQVIEDCSRVASCYPNQKLPSPAPWYEGVGATEGWDPIIHPELSIQDPKACINATISARFTQKMNAQSVEDHVRVYKCTTKEGTSCTLVTGEVAVYPADNGVRDYFKFGSPTISSPATFEAGSWYKIVLTSGIKSLFNVDMAVNNQVVADRFCNVSGITDAVYCWNFQTRTTNAYCDPGCPECNPDPKTLNYYFQTQQFSTDLISKDNVCLMIDPWAYNWDWSSEDESKVQITNTGGEPEQIGTAYGENYNLIPGFTKVLAELTQTGQNDYCRVITDFTNPVVMESAFCSRGSIQSPTPWINSKDACRNALIAARFSRDMDNPSLTLNTVTNITEGYDTANGNIIVERCDGSDDFEDAFPACKSIKIAEASSLRIFTYSHSVNVEDLLAGSNQFGQGTAEGFVIDINSQDLEGEATADEYLDSNMWYRVIILGGPDGVGGADSSGDGIPDGVLLTENSIIPMVSDGWDYNGDNFDDYYWVFKTSTQTCEVSEVQVTPAENFLEFVNQTSQYDAFPQASNCNILARCLLNWTWRSLIELGDSSETGDLIASITKLNVQTGICGGFSDSLIDPVQTATAGLDGETNIRADVGNSWGYGHLQVGYGELAVIKYSPRDLTHFEDRLINIDFNIDAKMSSFRINDNVKLYQCTNAEAYYQFDNSASDNSGNSNEAVVKGLSYVAGYFGQALNFRGNAGQYVEITNNNLKVTGALTVSAWVKPMAPESPLGRVVFSNYDYDEDDAKKRGFLLGDLWGCTGNEESPCPPPDHFQFIVYDSSGNFAIANKNNFFSDNLNKWTHVVGVYQPGQSVRLYINGALVAQDITNVPASVAYSPGVPSRIGHRADNNIHGMWNGLIDDVRFYDRALTSNEVGYLYTSNNDCPVFDLSPKTLEAVLPPTSGGLELSRKTTVKSATDYEIGSKYRVVVKGGEDGLIAWNNNQLSRLNFNSTGEGGGEECEPGIYPWTEQAGVCGASCLLNPLLNLCGGRFAECPAGSAYCSGTCHNEGNNNTASCGNGVVETAKEECDDRNANGDDGCGSNCLWEGSSDRWGSLCGNASIEYGENCDDGNTTSSDGCSSICLKESGRPSGSSANVPVCGNGIKEQGEDCDDSNKNTNDGCGSTCLLEGSNVAYNSVCGNDLVEAGQADSFSWTFSAVNDPAVIINMNNCSNGIWQVLAKRGDISANSIFICKRDALAMSDDTIWGKIISKIKLAISQFFTSSASAGSSDGCGAGYSVVSQNATNFEERLEYMNQDSHIYSFIKNGYWEKNKRYKISVYEGDFDPIVNNVPKISKEVTIQRYCQLSDVKVEIWPRGEEKYDDNFFCVGDDCGLHTADGYDNDISSGSNVDAPTEDYDFPYLRVDGANTIDPNLAKNQHLYMAWAVNDAGFLIKAEGGFNWDVAGLPKFDLAVSDFDLTDYSGDQWLNLRSARVTGAIDGQDVLTVGATQNPPSGEGASSTKEKEVNIKIFLCSNPWPAPRSFPYRDAADNCGGTPCPNTNFEVYYCRDNGEEGEADDLPDLDTSTIVYGGNPFKKEFLLQRTDKSDAVGIRVVANDNHYSPLVWYRENFDPTRQGNPQSLTVNGYEAIKEGRTIYANAINVEPDTAGPDGRPTNARALYPNIYLISYSEGADSDTQNIYAQMAQFMKFNVGSVFAGGIPNIGTCEGDDSYKCWDSSDCDAVEAGACTSNKTKLARDTKRLGDIQDINWLLDDYHNQKRCSNDKFITCVNSAECYGGGTCGNFYPDLPSGTYISGRSFSVWPSWQATLGNVLGSALPVDPLNTSSGFDGCESPYDSITCWNDVAKSMQCPTAARVYAYFANNNGVIKNVYAFKEFISGSWRPADWSQVRFMDGDPFTLAVSSICRAFSGTCGDGIEDLDGPDNNPSTLEDNEDCSTCPFDVVCSSGNSCRQTGATWSCTPDSVDIDSDGDSILNASDNCPNDYNPKVGTPPTQPDTDSDNIGNACDNCASIKNGSSASLATCFDRNGDGNLGPLEKSACNQADNDGDTVGNACDNCPNDYNPDQAPDACVLPDCGDSVVQAGEACDDGNNTNAGTCNAQCSAATFCGDSVIQGLNGRGQSETCDDGNGFSGDGCSNVCAIEPNWTCSGLPSTCIVPLCGDGLKQATETCDCGDAVGPLSGPSDCGNTGLTYTTHNIPPGANLNNYFMPFWNLTSVTRHYCTSACVDQTVIFPYCHDGEWNAINEQCEGTKPDGSPTLSDGSFGWGEGESSTNQWACNNVCQDSGGWCGDGTVQAAQEQCEPGVGTYGHLCQSSCNWQACPPYDNSVLTLSAFSGSPSLATISGVPACNEFNKLKANFTINATIPKAIIVFVNDLSASMVIGEDKLTPLKSSLVTTIEDIFEAIPDAEIGLVSFVLRAQNDVSSSQCSDTLCGVDQIDVLRGIVNAYEADSGYNSWSGTNPSDALVKAQEIISSATTPNNLALNKYVVLMSDGQATNMLDCGDDENNYPNCRKTYVSDGGGGCLIRGGRYRYNCNVYGRPDGINFASNIKNYPLDPSIPKTLIYSVSYGADADPVELNKISSNDGDGSCGSGFCYFGDTGNLTALYNSIISNIMDNLKVNFDVAIDTATTHFSVNIPVSGSASLTGQEINLPAGFCTDNGNNRRVSVSGAGFDFSMSNLNLGYCPYYPGYVALETEAVGGNVAGIAEEASGPNKLFNLINVIGNLLFNFLGRIFRM
ncbi:MAG: LamG-like jellyroll fold domain-containing protein [Candidatus Buchananbacteria bacterium]|nr:LamG-like jellyroll fold domain-containing protein [Candidatus Buchananbacteria bacterium]